MPLPPYIRRDPDARDERDYQTVYAAAEGAVAAPTAGLHFTRELLERIMQRGVMVLTVTLHVGYGTFRPVRDIATHRMHAEAFQLRPDVADALNRVRAEGRRVWAVGTTAVRVLETCAAGGRVVPGEGETDLFLYPPAEFEVASGLVTNFHLPRSTLLMLVGAFMGLDLMRRAYAHAVRQSYRFYSYGDSMLIL
jgi:S-adenosylmethionine:tRNA ribosyltransferase-isomerase